MEIYILMIIQCLLLLSAIGDCEPDEDDETEDVSEKINKDGK